MNSVSEILEELIFQVSTLEPPALHRMSFPVDFAECDQGLVFPIQNEALQNEAIQMPLEALVAEFQLPPKAPQVVISLLIDLSDSMRGGTHIKKNQPLYTLLLSMQEIISDQAKRFPAAKVRVSTFSDSVEHRPLVDIATVCAEGIGEFEASGCTAFFDSLCSTIDCHYKECPDTTVVFVVVTDGVDNASRSTPAKAAKMVKYVEAHKGSVIFLGANKSVVLQGEELGIKYNIEYDPAKPCLMRACTSETVSVELQRLTTEETSSADSLPAYMADFVEIDPGPIPMPTLTRSNTMPPPPPRMQREVTRSN